MKKEMLINVQEPEECRIAILEDGVLEELYVERTSHESYVGNIYKGKIVNIEPTIQAAFVDFGVGRNGFLHVSDVEPTYFRQLDDSSAGNGARSRSSSKFRSTAGPSRGEDTRSKKAPSQGERGRSQGDRGRVRRESRQRIHVEITPPSEEPKQDTEVPTPQTPPVEPAGLLEFREELHFPTDEGLIISEVTYLEGHESSQESTPTAPTEEGHPPAAAFAEDSEEPTESLPWAIPASEESSAESTSDPLEWWRSFGGELESASEEAIKTFESLFGDSPVGEAQPAQEEPASWEDDLPPYLPRPVPHPDEEEPVGQDHSDGSDPLARPSEEAPSSLEESPAESTGSEVTEGLPEVTTPDPGNEPETNQVEIQTEALITEETSTEQEETPAKSRRRSRSATGTGRGKSARSRSTSARRKSTRSKTADESTMEEDASSREESSSGEKKRPDKKSGSRSSRSSSRKSRSSSKSSSDETPREGEETPTREPNTESEERTPEDTTKPSSAEGDEKPPLMGSAERRTSEKDPAPEISHLPEDGDEDVSSEEEDCEEVGPAPEELEDDDDLFFPRSPEMNLVSDTSEEDLSEEEEPEEPEEADLEEEEIAITYCQAPPPRVRPASSRRSIEEELEADLRDAEVGEWKEPKRAPSPPLSSSRQADAERATPQAGAPRDEGARVDIAEPPEPAFEQEGDEDFHPAMDELDDYGAEDDFDDYGPDRGPGRGDRGRQKGRRRGRRDRGRMHPGGGRPRPLIQDIFKRGQEVIVQVIKEGLGSKGPTLSTYISIAGRYLVLMPSLNRVGVSRKINDDDQRRHARTLLNELKPPPGLGFIIRTAGADKTKKELQRDLAYLLRLWQVVARRIRKQKSPAEIYQESDMITRTIRDTFTTDIDTIWVDEPNAYEQAREFFQVVMPRFVNRLKLYEGKEPLFHRYGIEDEIARIHQRKVPLPEGGSIVIDQTEALVAIDVNSGNFRADNNAEETAYRLNLHAAKEIARQLRLRDLGGVIVNDFIDMREEKHRRGVEKALRDAVKRDRARTKILRFSTFGIIEMTRQRIRTSLKRSAYEDCPACRGGGVVKSVESMGIEVIRMLQLARVRDHVHRVEVHVAEPVADYLLNRKRSEIARLEETGEIQVQIHGIHRALPESLEFLCFDNHDNEVKFSPPEIPPRARRN